MKHYLFYNFLSYFVIFPLLFIKNLKSFVIDNFKGHNISFLDVPLSSPTTYNVIQFKC